MTAAAIVLAALLGVMGGVQPPVRGSRVLAVVVSLAGQSVVHAVVPSTAIGLAWGLGALGGLLISARAPTRLRAIAEAAYHGLLPSAVYERVCHYAGMTYREHLLMNAAVAWRWATWREDEGDRALVRGAS